MEELLLKLRKAVNHALDVRAPGEEIHLHDFPAYVVKSLEEVLADVDQDRATSRLGLLKAKVDEAVDLIKQSAGSAEDTESQRINVPVFEEPGLTSKPNVESETSPAAAGGALGASGVAAADGAIAKAIDKLRQEVEALKKAIAAGKGKDGGEEGDKEKARGKPKSDGSEEDQQKARGKPKGDGSEEDQQKARGKPKGDGSEEDQQKARGKPKGDGSEEDQQKARGKPKGDGSEEDQQKAGGKGKDGDEGDGKKAGVTKSAGWSTDMNATMPGGTEVTKRHPDLEWGSDPDDISAAQ